jgi:hypothetical protein
MTKGKNTWTVTTFKRELTMALRPRIELIVYLTLLIKILISNNSYLDLSK